ncbi:ornithine cyclodeaminase family protein [Saccharopolyspora sp. 5N102]|uniref:ornithine cyclodeaminase family protein n=1 Tax=Saccharopolyspora sp. 5N102 TaxID=3375155 RepID=UPI00378F26EB
MVRILTRSDVRSLISMDEVIDAVQKAHEDLALGRADQPERHAARTPGTDAHLIPMTAALADGQAGGVKLLADVPANPARALPRQQSTIVLVNPENGVCEAFLDGGAITQYRTAAASAVATRCLARPDARVLGLIGAGAQARSHFAAITRVRPIDRVLVWSRTEASARAFRDAVADSGVDIEFADSPEQVVRGSDVLCTLTPAATPVVAGRWFGEGLHVNAVGAPPRRDHREIDTDGIARARVVVDSLDTALAESGAVSIALDEGAITVDHVRDELGEVLTGAKPGRRDDAQITLFNSVGVPIQDLATARILVDRARDKGIGIEISLPE